MPEKESFQKSVHPIEKKIFLRISIKLAKSQFFELKTRYLGLTRKLKIFENFGPILVGGWSQKFQLFANLINGHFIGVS